WLAEEVRTLGHIAEVPIFPTPEGQSLDSWKTAFSKQVGNLTSNMVLVGHSLGPGFILSLLEEAKVPIIGTFLVSGFLGKLGLEDFDPINESFVCRDFRWERIRLNAGDIHIYNSDNDPYVPLTKGEELAKRLGVQLTVIKKGGHINASAGFLSFPQLLEDLKLLISK
ncbi:MAG: alpha/beta hydrolase, partial [Pseudomonadota bacterium]